MSPVRQPNQPYPTARDAWAYGLFAVVLAIALATGLLVAQADPILGAMIAATIGAVAYVVFFRMSYQITCSHVVVRLGAWPVWKVALDQIVEAEPVSSTRATVHFACASEAVRIVTRRRLFGLLPPTIVISPVDRSEFLSELAASSPAFEQGEDGAVRRRDRYRGGDSPAPGERP